MLFSHNVLLKLKKIHKEWTFTWSGIDRKCQNKLNNVKIEHFSKFVRFHVVDKTDAT